MIDVVTALQEYKDTKDIINFWNKKIDNYIYEQEYGLSEYEELCYELQHVWPNTVTIPRQRMLQDVIVKEVPYTKGTVYYAMCTYPNYNALSSNIPAYIAPTIDNVMFCKDHGCYEMAAVAFFNSTKEARKYYRDIVRVGEIVFFVMSCYYFTFKEISDINISKFKKLARISIQENSRSFLNCDSISWHMIPVMDAILSDHDNNLGILPDSKMCKILYDCLVTFKNSSKFIGRCC